MERSFAAIFVACLFTTLFALVAHANVAAIGSPALRISALPAGIDPVVTRLVAGQYDAMFAPLAGARVETSTHTGRWYRLALDRAWNGVEPAVLSIAEAGYSRAQLHVPPDYRAYPLWHAQPDAQLRFSRRKLTHVLPADLQAGQPIYLHLDATRTLKRPLVTVAPLADYQREDLRHVRISTMFASVQFTMVLAGLCLWLALRDRVFAYFVGYAGLQLVYLLLVSGELYDLPGGGLFAPFGQKAFWLFAILSAPLAISFILEFCDLHRIMPRAARVLSAMRWPFFAGVALMALPALDRVLPIAINVFLLLTSLTAIGVIALAAWRGNRASRFFLAAWMPQVALTVFRVIQLLLGLPQPGWLEYGVPFTMAFSSIVVTLGLADATLHARRERDVAHRDAERDGLTGVLNRRALTTRLASAMADAQAHSKPLALLFLDLDHFKAINDRNGHLAGDLCLKAVADAASAWLRPGQTFGRYGGEEFLAFLPGVTRAEAIEAGEQLRRRIEGLTVDVEEAGLQLRLTASIGIANLLGSDDTPEQLIERADHALYRAKAEGRNCVGIHAQPAAVGT